MARALVACLIAGVCPAAVVAQDTAIITTNPAGDPVTITVGQILTLMHEAGDLPNISARIWSLLDQDGNLIPGEGMVPEPIFDWLGYSDSNPLTLGAGEGPSVQIRIFEPGTYRIRLEAFGDGDPGHIVGSSAPGFIELGNRLELTGPPGFQYQWKKDGAPLPGETAQQLVIASVTLADAGSYTLEYNNGLSAAKAIVETPPFELDPLPMGSLPAGGPATIAALMIFILAGGMIRAARAR